MCFSQCTRNDESCGRTNYGCFSTAIYLLSTSWATNSPRRRGISSCWNNLPIHVILLRVGFSFPQTSNDNQLIRFEGVEAIKQTAMTELMGITEKSFQQFIEAWQGSMVKHIRLEGEYSEEKTEIDCLCDLPRNFSATPHILQQEKLRKERTIYTITISRQ